MSGQSKATSEVGFVYLTEETETSETLTTTLTTLITETDPSGIPLTNIQTVTISITSTEN